MDGSIRMSVEVKIRAFKAPLIEHIQIEAIDDAMKSLRTIKQGLELIVQNSGYHTQPPRR